MKHHTHRQPHARRPCPGTLMITPSLLISAALLIAAAACNGDNSGNGNTNNTNTNDAGVTPDAEVDAGPWTYECPTDQPTDHVCIRGQVLDFVTDEPVTVPADALMTMYAARNKDDFPNELEAEVVVQPDGRFIFPSVPVWMSQELRPDDNPDYLYANYHLFKLRLESDVASYRVPDNRFGVDVYDFDFSYYVISEDTVTAWEENWIFKEGEAPDYWILDVDASYRTTLAICYDEGSIPLPPQPHEGADLSSSREPDSLLMIQLALKIDRLHFIENFPYSTDSGGTGLQQITSELTSTDRVWVNCAGYANATRLALGQSGPAELDESSQLMVMHGPVIVNW